MELQMRLLVRILCPEKLYDKIFKLTDTRKSNEKNWSREAIIRISSALDIACWDLIGKNSKLPLQQIVWWFQKSIPCCNVRILQRRKRQ